MFVPALGPDGIRQTVNAHLTPAQTTWNMRSAFNVAALNCMDPVHAAILPAYKSFLKNQVRPLSATNRAIDAEFRGRYGPSYVVPREAYMTQVYNYFALPPAQSAFCDTALAISQESLLVPPSELDAFAARTLPRLEAVFDAFYRTYEKYRIDSALWDAQYAPPPVMVAQPVIVNQPVMVNQPVIISGPLVQAIPGGAATTPRPMPASGTLVLPAASLPPAPVSPAAIPSPSASAAVFGPAIPPR